ncbi:AAA family ATPase [Elioraea rosea]|uniref:AAA family ATPase n=1 Tax=Elioraea rosea TaxID=2492390 RepID=UPI0011827697|nr:AAA family ATPase [Elioraea rosea]
MFMEVPDWLLGSLNRPRDRSEFAGECLLPEDSASTRALAIREIMALGPAIAGAGGDPHTIVVANRALDFVTPATALEIMDEYWNEECAPPWDVEDLERKIASAAKSRKNPIQYLAPEANFEKVEISPVGTGGDEDSDDEGLRVEHAPDVFFDVSAPETLKGVIGCGSVTMLYGAPNEGKTFVAMDFMAAVAKGEPWMGRKTRQGLCLHVAMEGEAGIKKRYTALHREKGANGLYLMTELLALTSETNRDTRRLISAYRKLLNATGMSPGVICIDTVALAIGGDEDKTENVSPFLKAMRRIAQDTGATVLLLHHPGKDESRGPRGSSGFNGNVDQTLYMKRGRIILQKVRDGSKDKAMTFSLRVVEIGRDADGDPVTTCVVRDGAASIADDFDPPVARLTPALRAAFDAVAGAAAEIGKPEGEMVWLPRADATKAAQVAKRKAGKGNSAGARAVDDLVKKGALERRVVGGRIEIGVPAEYVTPRAAPVSHSGQGVGNAVH